jgi:hypothetical protein
LAGIYPSIGREYHGGIDKFGPAAIRRLYLRKGRRER